MEYRLRPLEDKDCNGMLEWMHDPAINYFYTDKIKNATSETVRMFVKSAGELQREGVTYHYAIVDASDEYMGTISLKDIETIKGAEYAVSMRRACQGKGAASWATQEILRVAFEQLWLNRVYLNVLSDNQHANDFYVKNGFRYEGESKNCIQIGNEIKSLKWYAILAEEFAQRRNREKGTKLL